MKEVFKTSSNSNPNSVAGAIAGATRSNADVEVQAIGAGAINQTVKAIAIARGFLAPSGIDLSCKPSFIMVTIHGEEKTGIKFELHHK